MWCRMHRRRISAAFDGGGEPGPATRRHLRRCAACADFEEHCRELEERLTLSADLAPAPRAHAGTRAAAAAPRRPFRVVFPARLALGAAAVAAAVVLTFMLRDLLAPPQPTPTNTSGLAAMDRMASPAAAGTAIGSLADAQMGIVQGELDNIASDAADAARMVLAYLPQVSPGSPPAAATRP